MLWTWGLGKGRGVDLPPGIDANGFAFLDGEATVGLVMLLTKERGWNMCSVDDSLAKLRRRKAAELSYQEKWAWR